MGYALLWLLRILEELDAKFRLIEAIYGRVELGISHIKSVFQRSNSQLKTLLNLLIKFRVLEETLVDGYVRFRRGKYFFQTLQATKYLVRIVEGENLDFYGASVLAEALENDEISNLLSCFFEEPKVLAQPALRKSLINTILRGENQLVRHILKPAKRAKIRLHTAKDSKPSIQVSPYHQPFLFAISLQQLI